MQTLVIPEAKLYKSFEWVTQIGFDKIIEIHNSKTNAPLSRG